MKVSIIIPVYNNDKAQLKRCLNSVCNNVKKLEQCKNEGEVIIIDDGSTNVFTSNFCKNYVNTHEHFSYYFVCNGGVSKARNAGMKLATGDYICFVDSDDCLSENGIIMPQKNDLYSIVFSDIEAVYKRKKVLWSAFEGEERVISITEVIKRVCNDGKLNGPVAKLFSRSFLQDNSIEFDTKLNNGEDLCFLIDCLQCNPKMYYIDKISYYYFFPGRNSYSRMKRSPDKYLKDILSVEKKMSDLIIMKGNTQIETSLHNKVVNDLFNFLCDMVIIGVSNERYYSVIMEKLLPYNSYDCLNFKTRIKLSIMNQKSKFLITIIAYVRQAYLLIKDGRVR